MSKNSFTPECEKDDISGIRCRLTRYTMTIEAVLRLPSTFMWQTNTKRLWPDNVECKWHNSSGTAAF